MKKKKILKRMLSAIVLSAMVLTSVTVAEPADSYAATKTVTVSNQKQLDAALKSAKKTSRTILIKTKKSTKFIIKKGTYSRVTLKVNAAKSSIVNNAKFSAVQIDDAKNVTEKGKSNAITVKDKKIKIVIDKKVSNTTISSDKNKANLNLIANGIIKNLAVNAAQKVNIKGTCKGVSAVSVNKKGAVVSASVPVKFSLKANATITLKKGAEKSSVQLKKGGIVAKVNNKTNSNVSVKDSNGNKVVVKAGTSEMLRMEKQQTMVISRL